MIWDFKDHVLLGIEAIYLRDWIDLFVMIFGIPLCLTLLFDICIN